jgi:glutathione S-transferase
MYMVRSPWDKDAGENDPLAARWRKLRLLFDWARRNVASAKDDLMPHYTAIVTLLTVGFYFFLATRVAGARGKFGVTLPATTGNADFERIFRVHMNTLEWMPTFLISLWLCAIYLNDIAAAALGLVWIGGRAVYFVGYSKAVEKRLPGFFIQAMACFLLFIGAIAGIVINWSVT